MNYQPLISVIIPVYNVAPYLRQCLDSVVEQTYHNLEILIVNDGSTDESGEICDEYAKKDSRIRTFHKENGGLSSARNVALPYATGNYITFVDSDDWIEPDTYTTCVNYLREYTNVDILEFGFSMESEGNIHPPFQNINSIIQHTTPKQILYSFIYSKDGMTPSVWRKIFRRSLVDDIRFREGFTYEDVPFTLHTYTRTKNYLAIPNSLYHYRRHKGQITEKVSPEILNIFDNLMYEFELIKQEQSEYLPVCNLYFIHHLEAIIAYNWLRPYLDKYLEYMRGLECSQARTLSEHIWLGIFTRYPRFSIWLKYDFVGELVFRLRNLFKRNK